MSRIPDLYDKQMLLDRLLAQTKSVESCWLYTGPKTTKYGSIHYGDRRNVLVHRISYAIFYDFDIDSKKMILHRDEFCNHRNCWNPAHLYIGDAWQNSQDRTKKHYRGTHCKWGHERTKENTYINNRNTPVCRICQHASVRRYYARAKNS